MWQEITVYIIIAIATALVLRKVFMKIKQPSSCDGCSTDSCAACGLADLKKDMDKAGKDNATSFSVKKYSSS